MGKLLSVLKSVKKDHFNSDFIPNSTTSWYYCCVQVVRPKQEIGFALSTASKNCKFVILQCSNFCRLCFYLKLQNLISSITLLNATQPNATSTRYFVLTQSFTISHNSCSESLHLCYPLHASYNYYLSFPASGMAIKFMAAIQDRDFVLHAQRFKTSQQ